MDSSGPEIMLNLDLLSPVLLSAKVSLVSGSLVVLLGLLASWGMGNIQWRGKWVLECLIMLPLVLSPSVIGLILLLLLGRNSFLGHVAQWCFHHPIVFTWWGGVAACTVISFPLAYQLIKLGLDSVDIEFKDAARVDGATDLQVFFLVVLPMSYRFLSAAFLIGVARSLGEFGATMMIAGNIPQKTQTLPTAVYLAVDTGNITLAGYWAAWSIFISFLLLLFIHGQTSPPKKV